MAITKQNTPGSRNINIQYVQNLFRLFPVQRIALHLYAYITVFRIFILTLVSLTFLSIHWTIDAKVCTLKKKASRKEPGLALAIQFPPNQ